MATPIETTEDSIDEKTVSSVDPHLLTQPQIVHQDQVQQEQLYIDFASDAPPVSSQNSQTVTDANNSSTQPKRIDPRQEWINNDTTKPYYCKLCDHNMDSMQSFQHHCMCARHIKRAIEEFNIKLPKKLEEKDEKKAIPQYNCQVCLVTCNSDTAWNSHLIGQKHRKALEKQGAERAQQKAQEKVMTNPMMNTGFGRGGRGAGGRGGGVGPIRGGAYGPGHSRKPYDKPVHAVQQPSTSGPIGAKDFATYPEPLIGLEYVTEIQVIGQSPRYHCELCDSKFDHNLKFPHLVGSKHRFNVLKEKVPEVAHGIRGDVKKRSELSSKLLEEARNLEMRVGRQQVKTRMEKSPFNRVNNQAAGQGNMQSARGGGQQWQSQRGRGQGGARGGRGGTYGSTGHTYAAGNQGNYGASNQGNSYSGRGGQGGMRGGRGRQQGTPYNHQQQSGSTRGGRGRGRGSTGNSHNQSWVQNSNYSSYDNTPNQPFPAKSYSSGSNSQWNSGSQGQDSPMLPPEAFKPRSPPRSTQYSDYQDEYYDDYYSGNQQTSESYNDYSYEYNQNQPYSSQSTNDPKYYANDQPFSYGGGGQSFSSGNAGTTGGRSAAGGSGAGAAAAGAGGGDGASSVSLLQGAIADLGKLVSSEEDASMALQVSNALTQALLQFRMNNLPKENLADNSAAASAATTTNT